MIEGVRRKARVCVGDSTVRKTDRALSKGNDMVVSFPGAKIETITDRMKKAWAGQGRTCFSTRRD